MKIKRLLPLCLSFSLLSGCGNKIEYVQSLSEPTEDELIVEYIPYKESVYKQLENQIENLDKMEETEFKILNNENKSWMINLCMMKKDFGLHSNKCFQIEASGTTITSNNFTKVFTQTLAEEKIADAVDYYIFKNDKIALIKDYYNGTYSFSYTIKNKDNPTFADYSDPNNDFYLYINLDGASTIYQATCSDQYFADMKEAVDNLLKTESFKDLPNITITIFVAGCGQLEYIVSNGESIVNGIRTRDGAQKVEDAGKTEFDKMTDEERQNFFEENKEILDKAMEDARKSVLRTESGLIE